MQSVGGAGISANAVAKYGSEATFASANTDFIKALKFNSWGQLSNTKLFAPQNTNDVPFMETSQLSLYSTTNVNSYSSAPTKNYLWGVNGYMTAYRGAGCIDAFDPAYLTYANQFYANEPIIRALMGSPYMVMIMTDDTGFLCGYGAGEDNNTTPSGVFKANLAFLVMIAPPTQVYNAGFTYASTPIQYADTKIHTKTAMASPPMTCAIATPCSLRDFLQKRYTTIAALNTAWGTSSYYTTFDSAGSVVTDEVIGTGDGMTKTFTATLANTSVSPMSVAVKVGGTLQGGDCPWYESRCNLTTGQASTPYTCGTPGNCIGALAGAAGTNIDSGTAAPWAQQGQITSANAPGSGLPQANYAYRTTWAGCTNPMASRQVSTGLIGTGEPRITITTQNNSADNPPCATGVNIYVSCRVGSGAAAFGCAAASDPFPAETLQATNVAYPGGSWQQPLTGLVAGSALPTPANLIDYGSGDVQVTFATAPTIGQSVTISYIHGGWMFGTGLMDEDGRHTTWVGTNPICLLATVGGGPGTQGYTCDGVINPVANMNQTMAADLDEWQEQFSGRYFKTLRDAVKASFPDLLYGGTDTLGDWNAPARKRIIQGAAPFVDIFFTGWLPNQPSVPGAAAGYAYMTQYAGDVPMINSLYLHAQPDSAMAGNTASNCCYGLSTQPLRGVEWNTIVTGSLGTLSYNSTYQWVGVDWWGLHDYTNEGINWGLKTPTDNAYNPTDAVSGSTMCAAPLNAYTCGSEPAPSGGATRPFGDLLTSVAAANTLWYNGTPPAGNSITVSGSVKISGLATTR